MSEENNYINEADFDSLLGDTFLNQNLDDPKNQPVLDAISSSVLNPDKVIYSGKAKSLKQFWRKINLRFVIIASFIAITSAIIVSTFDTSTDIPLVETPFPAPYTQSPEPLIVTTSTVSSINTINNSEKYEQERLAKTGGELLLPKDSNIVLAVTKMDSSMYTESVAVSNIMFETKNNDNGIYVFPHLTDKDIKANNKQRKKMQDQLLKIGKSKYMQIPNGSINYKGDKELIEGCYMQQTEVTNLEYRTFLFDLLIQNKKEDFLKAKPNQSLWINSNGTSVFDNYKEEYFSNKKFNEYPVVNISLEGSKLYCEWLTDLYNIGSDQKNENKKNVIVRLPKESEWIYCAMGGFKDAVYPWGKDSIQNERNCFLANFCVQKLKEKFHEPYGYTEKINLNAYTSAGLALNNDTIATAKVSEYNPNWYRLYCMSGNVSEIVLMDHSNFPKALGGNWNSDFEHLQINCADEFKGQVKPSPFIGFRPILYISK